MAAKRCPRCGALLLAIGGVDSCPACVLGLAIEAGRSEDGEPDPRPDREPRPGDRIGPYVLTRRLGEGGMGVVFLAEQEEPLRREVALKIVKRGMDTAQVLSRFEAEAQALARMDHPAIARAYGAGETEDGRPYFVMEAVRGEPVTVYADRKRFTTRERLDLFARICDGVQHAHQKGVIHRDLKPTNVLVVEVDGAPRPKIIDFGIAKAVAQPLVERTLFTELGVLLGTPEYMSPEQADPSALDIDTRSDVYSLGVVLYELLVGDLPFASDELRAAGFEELLRRIREDDPPLPSVRLSEERAVAEKRRTDPGSLRRQVTGDLDWITARALEKDRNRRYPSASALAADVRRHLADEPVEAGPPSVPYRVGKFVRRHRWLVASAAAVAAALVAGAVGMAVFGLREAAQRREAERARADLDEVASFQQRMLAELDAASMGRGLLGDLRERALSAAGEAGEARADVESFDRLVGRVNATDVALRAVDLEILDRAARAADARFADRPAIRARLLGTIGRTYMDLGLYERARPHLEAAFEIRSEVLGRSHLDTADSLDALATLAWRESRNEEAEPLFLEALDVRRSVLGDEHRETLRSRNNLALLYKAMGRYPEAETLAARTLEARRRVLGDDDPDTTTSVNILATLLDDQGRVAEAEILYREVVERRKRLFGEDGLPTLLALNNLGGALRTLNRFEEAEPLMRASLEGRRRTLGTEHPETLMTANGLAALYRDMGRYAEAEALQRETIAAKRRVLGADHASTLSSENNLAIVLADQEKYEEAGRIHERLLEIRRRTLGPEHPHTLASMHGLATCRGRTGREPEALALFEETLATKTRVLGPSHASTLATALGLGRLLAERGEHARSEPFFRDTLARARETHSGAHQLTAAALTGLGTALAGLGRFEEGEAALLEAEEMLSRLGLGPEHRMRREAARDLAALRAARGRTARAAE